MSTWFEEVTSGKKQVVVWVEKELNSFSLIFKADGISFVQNRSKEITGWRFQGKTYSKEDILANKTPFREYIQYHYDEYKAVLNRDKKLNYINDILNIQPKAYLDKLVSKLEKDTGILYKSEMDWLPKP